MADLPAPIDDDLNVGLEDFDSTDMVLPMLRLNHQDGCFVDNLSGETFEEKDVILLGLIKQRILWPPELGEDKVGPLCRSLNFVEGLPDRNRFPWKAAGFREADFEDDGKNLPCEACALKEWGSHPQRETPWCSEQFTFALLMDTGNGFSPALLTLQRSGIKGARAYMTAFKRSNTPLFTTVTHLRLQHNRRGTVKYSVVQFAKGAATNSDEWQEYAGTYRRIRDFVQTPREEVSSDEEPTTSTAPSKSTAASIENDDEIDF